MANRPAQDAKLNLPTVEVKGRQYTRYDPNVALDIVERIAEGELLSDITSKSAPELTVAKSTFLRWAATVPELGKAYAAAVQISASSFEEMAIDKARKVAAAPGSPQNVSAANLLVGQYRWSAARRNPTKYSDKGNTQIVVPVNISSTLNLGDGKSAIEVEVPDIYTISAPGSGEDTSDVIDGEFIEASDGENVLRENVREEETGTAEIKVQAKEIEAFREIVATGEPVVGVSHQPLLKRELKSPGLKPGHKFKRVLTPRTPKE